MGARVRNSKTRATSRREDEAARREVRGVARGASGGVGGVRVRGGRGHGDDVESDDGGERSSGGAWIGGGGARAARGDAGARIVAVRAG